MNAKTIFSTGRVPDLTVKSRMAQPKRINPEEALRVIREAAERRSNPIVDLSRINEYKHFFIKCALSVCPGFEIREELKETLYLTFEKGPRYGN